MIMLFGCCWTAVAAGMGAAATGADSARRMPDSVMAVWPSLVGCGGAATAGAEGGGAWTLGGGGDCWRFWADGDGALLPPPATRSPLTKVASAAGLLLLLLLLLGGALVVTEVNDGGLTVAVSLAAGVGRMG